MNIDPRFLRSQARLHEAVLELAASGPLESITVTQLAKAASVHRSTVYEHADSIEQLLRQAITAELDTLYATSNTIDYPEHSELDALFAILGYIETHERLYRRMSGASGAVIAEALSAHTANILLDLAAKGFITPPQNPTVLSDDEVLAITIRSMTDALIRVFSKWLELPAPRDLHLAAQLLSLVVPAWWDTNRAANPAAD